jgi:hypothetical protein
MVGFAPSGVVAVLMGIMARPRVSHVSDGVLALDGTGFETALLYPDGAPGRYRRRAPDDEWWPQFWRSARTVSTSGVRSCTCGSSAHQMVAGSATRGHTMRWIVRW